MKKLYTLLALASSLAIGNTASAQSGGSISLDGTPGKYVRVPHSAALNLLHGKGYTISAWVKNKPNASGRIISKRNGASGAGYELHVGGGSKLGVNITPTTAPSSGALSGGSYSTQTVAADSWSHVAMVVDFSPSTTTNIKMYIDGVLCTQSTAAGTYTTSASGSGTSPNIDVNYDFIIGASYSVTNSTAANTFNGNIDDVRFYDVAKNTSAIAADMALKTVDGTTPNLVAAWDFNSLNGTTIQDVTGHGHDATLVGLTTLPLDLISFKSVYNKINKNIELNWLTANEKNVKNFEILYSTNGKDFISTGTLASKGNNQTGNNTYNYKLAFNQTAAVIYVKLKMIDNDGKFTYSDVNAVVTTPNIEISVSPNPATDVLNVNIGQNTSAKITIIDANGKTVSTLNTTAITEKINVAALPAGTYILKVTTKTQTVSKKWLKK